MSTDFPNDLITAERERQQAVAERAALARMLPWSVEPLEGFDDSQIWRPRSRPDSPGYTPEQLERVNTLRATELDRAAAIAQDRFWERFSGAELVAARMELKQQTAKSAQQASDTGTALR